MSAGSRDSDGADVLTSQDQDCTACSEAVSTETEAVPVTASFRDRLVGRILLAVIFLSLMSIAIWAVTGLIHWLLTGDPGWMGGFNGYVMTTGD